MRIPKRMSKGEKSEEKTMLLSSQPIGIVVVSFLKVP